MALPLVTIYSCDDGWPRQMMIFFAGAMALVGTAAIVFSAADNETGMTFMTIFVIGFIATPWLANYLVMAKATR
jgi:hypothetical protein